MDVGNVGLQMADTQFYVMIAILTAVAAIVSAEVRRPGSLRPASLFMKRTAWLLLLAVWASIAQILLVMIVQNSHQLMTNVAVFNFWTHTVSLVILAVLVTVWHSSIAGHRETDAGLPPPPPGTSANSRQQGP